MSTTCPHLGEARDVDARTPEGCEECLKTGSPRVHLRLCLSCGHVGCCDNSPRRDRIAAPGSRHHGHGAARASRRSMEAHPQPMVVHQAPAAAGAP